MSFKLVINNIAINAKTKRAALMSSSVPKIKAPEYGYHLFDYENLKVLRQSKWPSSLAK